MSVAGRNKRLRGSGCGRGKTRIEPLNRCFADLRFAEKIGHCRNSVGVRGVNVEPFRNEPEDDHDMASACQFDCCALRRFWLSKWTELLKCNRNRSSYRSGGNACDQREIRRVPNCICGGAAHQSFLATILTAIATNSSGSMTSTPGRPSDQYAWPGGQPSSGLTIVTNSMPVWSPSVPMNALTLGNGLCEILRGGRPANLPVDATSSLSAFD